MSEEAAMRALVRKLVEKNVDEEMTVAVVSLLETEENYLKMIDQLSEVENPSREWLLAKSLLIPDEEA